ncbi:MAG: ATP-binding protein [Anaerolineae bacterium]|nr:ATP-binding protein [Anaerolineae bacterium]
MATAINPYIAGSPVRDPAMFFGRESLFTTIHQNLVQTSPSRIVVLHGQRRMGKTSMLYQLAFHIPEQYIPVLLDLQGMSLDGMASLLWEMMQVIRRAIKRTADITTTSQDRQSWFAAPKHSARSFFAHIQEQVGDRHLVLMFDETMLIADKIDAGTLEESIFDCFAELLTQFAYLDFVFSIGSKLGLMKDELVRLSRPTVYQEVGYLETDAARALITQPVRDILSYTPKAIEAILELSSGQPYYTQLICHELFNLMQSQDRTTVILTDVETVRPHVVELAVAQMHYVWSETPSRSKRMLLALAKVEHETGQGASVEQLYQALAEQGIVMPDQEIKKTLGQLEKRYIVTTSAPYSFRIGLFRHWILQNQQTG